MKYEHFKKKLFRDVERGWMRAVLLAGRTEGSGSIRIIENIQSACRRGVRDMNGTHRRGYFFVAHILTY